MKPFLKKTLSSILYCLDIGMALIIVIMLFKSTLEFKVYRGMGEMTITHYQAKESQTDSTPFETANLTRVKPGIVAVSRDLYKQGFTFGKKVKICNLGTFEIQDLMNTKKKRSIDIYTEEPKTQKSIGKQKCEVMLEENYTVELDIKL